MWPQKHFSMNCKISYTPIFERSLKRLAKHYKSIKSDFKDFLCSLHEYPFQGADLGGGLRKVRMPIASKSKGKSGGARVITFEILRTDDEVDIRLVDIYDKSEGETLTDKEIRQRLKQSGLL